MSLLEKGLPGNKLLEWNNLIATVTNIILQDERDTFVWHFKKIMIPSMPILCI
jgi:hypothetical protein